MNELFAKATEAFSITQWWEGLTLGTTGTFAVISTIILFTSLYIFLTEKPLRKNHIKELLSYNAISLGLFLTSAALSLFFILT